MFPEPGYYEDGKFGIRLENVLIVKEGNTKFNFGDKGYLTFEHITWVSFSALYCCMSLFAHSWAEYMREYILHVVYTLLFWTLMVHEEGSWCFCSPLVVFHAEDATWCNNLLFYVLLLSGVGTISEEIDWCEPSGAGRDSMVEWLPL